MRVELRGGTIMYKRTMGVTIFGIIHIIWGFCSIFFPWIIYEKVKPIYSLLMSEYFSLIKYFSLTISSFTLSGGIIFIIIGIGIFKLRPWAWYLIIAHEIIRILSLPNAGFVFGWQTYELPGLAIEIAWIIFILWFFMHPKIKEEFLIAQKGFKLKSWYGTLIILWLIGALLAPASVLIYKISTAIKGIEPFFVKRPQLIKLEKVDRSALQDNFKIREIFNLSFLTPEDFVLRGFDKKTGTLTLCDITNTDKNFIIIERKNMFEISRIVYKVMRFKNAYQFEEALYSNNWSIILLIFRAIGVPNYGDDTQIKRFDTSAVKGFIKYGYRKDKDRWVYDCSAYDKHNNSMGSIVLILEAKDFSQDEALRIISSIEISRKGGAEEYHQKGLQLLDEGDFINAQFAFANAYYSADIPEAGYMLAKSLLMNDKTEKQKFILIGTERILKEVLASKPNYEEAKELLALVNVQIRMTEKSTK